MYIIMSKTGICGRLFVKVLLFSFFKRRVGDTEQEYSLESQSQAQLNMVTLMGDCLVRFCTCPEISSGSNSVQTLQKSFGWDKTRSPIHVYTHAEKWLTLKILKSMSGFDRLWKWQNNPASTKIVESSECWKRRRRRMNTCTPFFHELMFFCPSLVKWTSITVPLGAQIWSKKFFSWINIYWTATYYT